MCRHANSRCSPRCSSGRARRCRRRSSRSAFTGGATKSRATPSRCTSTTCARSSAARRYARCVASATRLHDAPRTPMSSIRRTLLVWLLAGLALIALVATGATYLAARREVGELLDLQLKQLAYSTRIDDLLRGRRPGCEPRAQPSDAGITELVTQIWDRDGVLVYWSQPGMGLPVPATEGYSTASHDGRLWRVYTLFHGTHSLQVAQAENEREAIATQTALRTLVPFVALLPIFGALIWIGVGRG